SHLHLARVLRGFSTLFSNNGSLALFPQLGLRYAQEGLSQVASPSLCRLRPSKSLGYFLTILQKEKAIVSQLGGAPARIECLLDTCRRSSCKFPSDPPRG